jgi:[ribosomal protein S18]-alanine N-acetyltransferase
MPNSTRRCSVDRVKLRRATSADIPSVRQLERQTATAAHWSTAQYEALFAAGAQPRIVLIAADEPTNAPIHGFLVARCLPDDWEIENLVVGEQCRRCGVGLALVRELLAEAANGGVASVNLEVRESNFPATQLYEKIGFKLNGQRKNYYRFPTEDAFLYRILLQTCDKIS